MIYVSINVFSFIKLGCINDQNVPPSRKETKGDLFRDLAAANTNQDQLKNVISATEDVNNM